MNGDEGSRRVAHATLQAQLAAGCSAARALAALEGALLALEGARGASHSRGLAVVADRFTSAVLTLLSRTAAAAGIQLAGALLGMAAAC